jgi:hypothetical protein
MKYIFLEHSRHKRVLMLFLGKSFGISENGQKKCPKSKTQNTFRKIVVTENNC